MAGQAAMIPRMLAYLWLSAAALLVTVEARAHSLCTASLPSDRAALCSSNNDLFSDPRLIPDVSAASLSAESGVPAARAPSAAPRQPEGRGWKIGLALAILIVLGISLPLVVILLIRQLAGEMKSATCPNCGSSEVRISYPEGFLDHVFALASYAPHRCKVCYHRYHHKSAEPGRPVNPLARLKVPKYSAKE